MYNFIFDYFRLKIPYALNDTLYLAVLLTKLGRRTTLLTLEDAIEVAQIVIPTVETDIGNALLCVEQHTRSIAKTNVDDIVGQGA